MRNIVKKIGITAFAAISLLAACKKSDPGSSGGDGNNNNGGTPVTTDTTGTLKGSTTLNIGIAATYNLASTNSSYLNTIKREAGWVTFGNELKNASVVQNDGSLNFTTADNFYNLCTNSGLQVYGHTLCWYSQQNTNYLNTLKSGTTASTTNLISNGSFESGISTNWFTQVSSTGGAAATFSVDNTTAQDGAQSLKVVVTTPGPNSYSIQAVNDAFTGTGGSSYTVSMYIKGAGAVKAVMQGTQYDGDNTFTTTATWTKYSWTITLNSAETAPQVRLNFTTAGTYNIDNITVVANTTTTLPAAQIAANVDTALKREITGIVTHYAGKIKAWDVVNEAISDNGGNLRTSANTPAGNGFFFWADYLGRNFGLKAFQYAKAADPNALLFINDYNLEYSNTKLDSLIAYVKELQGKGAKIDGIGTQMHINLNTTTTGIDNAFIKLAATGLKVRISELDIALNSGKAAGFTASSTALTSQATLYKYVIDSYQKNVPKAQQYGITIWGVADTDSWLNSASAPDFPLLFNAGYAKKPAYYSVLLSLKGQ
ncbi:endo-1,4-beta-xylanase [Mucilaginibacter sp. AW1-3]